MNPPSITISQERSCWWISNTCENPHVKAEEGSQKVQPSVLRESGFWKIEKWEAKKKSFPEHELKLVPACLASLLHSLLLSVPCESGFWTVEKWKVKKKCHSLFSRSASEKKMTWDRDREMKVKWKWLKIEIEKWKWNKNDSRSRLRSEKNSRESRLSQVTAT